MEVTRSSGSAHDPEPSASTNDNSFSGRTSTTAVRTSLSTSTGEGSSHRGSHESEPRLSKDQQETLERHYLNNSKPSTATKKEFSELLGVSVEKINNRRAKTKQDVRKKQEQNLYHFHDSSHLDSFGHPLADDRYIDNAFYQTLGFVENTEMHNSVSTPHQHSRRTQPSQGQLDGAAATGRFSAVHEEPAYGESAAFLEFMGIPSSEAERRQVDTGDASAMRRRFNTQAEHFYAGMPTQPNDEQQFCEPFSALAPFDHGGTPLNGSGASHDDSSHVSVHQPDGHWRQSSSDFSGNVSASNSRESPSTWTQVQSPLTVQNSNPRTVFEDAMKAQMSWSPTEIDGQSSTLEHGFVHHRDGSFVAPQPMLPSQGFYGQPRSFLQHDHMAYPNHEGPPSHFVTKQESQPHNRSVDFATQSTQGGQDEADFNGFAHGFSDVSDLDGMQYNTGLDTMNCAANNVTPARCDSGTSLLAETMDEVELQPLPSTSIRKSSLNSSGLALRRQRRPAALGQAALRSMSYNNGPVSAFDATSKHSAGPDAHLRRIKSSTGVLNGRVQKSNTSSAQRSPFSSTFAEASSAAHGPRHTSNQSFSASLRSPSHEAFTTPTTPGFPNVNTPHLHLHQASNDSGRTLGTGNGSENAESLWSAMPNTAGTTNSSIYHSMPQTANTARSYLSPPHTPMDMTQLSQANPNMAQQYSLANSPHPAPPWQPQFAPPFVQWHGDLPNSIPPHWNPAMSSGVYNDANIFVPQDCSPHQPPSFSTSHGSSELPDGHARHSYAAYSEGPTQLGQYSSPVSMHMSQHIRAGSSPQAHQFAFPANPESVHSNEDTTLANGQAKQKQEVQFQQYEPREPADPSSLPPKTRNTPPKGNYTFHNTLSETFNNTKPASSPLKIACDIDGNQS